MLKKLRIVELPIPTYYGDEICYVNGTEIRLGHLQNDAARAISSSANLLFDRRFDLGTPDQTYDLKLDFPSSHTAAIEAARPGGHLLDVGCGQGYVARS